MLNGKPVVLLDVDDVVCRCIHGMAKLASERLGQVITEEDVKTWDFHETFTDPALKDFIYDEMKKKDWCLGLEPFPGALEGVPMLQQIAEVFFVTSPFDSEFWEYERRLWLNKHFDVSRKRIIQGMAKFPVRGEFFVDDKPKNVIEWSEYMPGQGHALLWDRPHNRSDTRVFDRIYTWEELYVMVRG